MDDDRKGPAANRESYHLDESDIDTIVTGDAVADVRKGTVAGICPLAAVFATKRGLGWAYWLPVILLIFLVSFSVYSLARSEAAYGLSYRNQQRIMLLEQGD